MCSKCQHIFSFSAVEKFFTKTYRPTDLTRARDLFMRSKPKPTILTGDKIYKGAVPAHDLPPHELLEIIQHLGIRKVEPNVFQGIQAFCDAKRKSLYFPMIDVESNMVGYKKLSRSSISDDDGDSAMVETTSPEQNSYGAVIFPPFIKRGYRDQKTAIIVLNMLDALALRMEKTNCKYFFVLVILICFYSLKQLKFYLNVHSISRYNHLSSVWI